MEKIIEQKSLNYSDLEILPDGWGVQWLNITWKKIQRNVLKIITPTGKVIKIKGKARKGNALILNTYPDMCFLQVYEFEKSEDKKGWVKQFIISKEGEVNDMGWMI